MNKPFQYKVPKHPSDVGTPAKPGEIAEPVEQLTGLVNGEPASDFEERFAVALMYEKIPFEFQPSFITGRNMPGEIRPDFVVYTRGISQPVQIDGDFAHKNSGQREEDEQKDQLLDEALREYGALPTLRLREGDVDMSSIEACRDLVRANF